MAEQTLTFRCSNCGFEGESGSWWSVSQHCKKNPVCKMTGAKVLTIVDGVETALKTTPAPLQSNMTPDEQAKWVAEQTNQPVVPPPPVKISMAEKFATKQIEEINDDEVDPDLDSWGGFDDNGTDDIDDEGDNLDEGYDPRFKRVTLGRTSAVELPAWVVATYEAFAGYGYSGSPSQWIEEQIALNLIFLGVNVQIMPYSDREREAMLLQIGAIAQEVA